MDAAELANSPLFEGLTPEQLHALAALFHRVTIGGNEIIFAQGEPATALYVLLSGRVVIQFYPEDGECLDVATIVAGGVFGWSAALARPYYTSSAIGLEDGQAAVIRSMDIRRVITTEPELGSCLLDRMAAVVASRYEGLRDQVRRLLHASQMVGLPAGQDGRDHHPFQ
ncbi:MAG: cyclic nucleotide-binding domain-containing protein [Anaerolineales bacterium]